MNKSIVYLTMIGLVLVKPTLLRDDLTDHIVDFAECSSTIPANGYLLLRCAT